MKLITQREMMGTVLGRWSQTYKSGKYGQDKINTLNLLSKLDFSKS